MPALSLRNDSNPHLVRAQQSTVIRDWNWRYRVSYDLELAEKVVWERRALGTGAHAGIFDEVFRVFASFVSVSQLVEDVCSESSLRRRNSFLEVAETKPLLYLPPVLMANIEARVWKSTLSKSQRSQLKRVIERATHSAFKNFNDAIFRPIFGHHLDGLLKKGGRDLPPRFPDSPLPAGTLSEVVPRLLAELKSRVPGPLIGVASLMPEFDVAVERGVGFAEYWPVGLTNSRRNRLVIYDNPDQKGERDIKATLAHEVYGHAIFYNAIERERPPFVDHGAMALIEGWATWCEWVSSPPEVANVLQQDRCRSLRLFRESSEAMASRDIRDTVLAMGYSDAMALMSLEYFFQYPGFNMSYTLGALWMDAQLGIDDAAAFLHKFADEPVGDFFALW